MTVAELKQFGGKTRTDLILTKATALAYTSILSLIPILAIAFYFFKAFGGLDAWLNSLEPLIQQNLAPSFSTELWAYVDRFLNNVHAGTLGTLGILGFIITSLSTLVTIENTFNTIWGVNRSRSLMRRATTYWTLLTIGPLFLGFSLWLSSKILIWAKSDHTVVAQLLVWVLTILPYAGSGLLFSLLYLFMPNVEVHYKDAFKSGFIVGAIFEIAKLVYAGYAAKQLSQASIYGSLAIIPLFLIWLYVVWLIVLVGAELCCYFQFKRQGIPYRFTKEENLSPFLLSDIVEELALHQKAAPPGITFLELLDHLKCPVHDLVFHLEFLESQGLIVASASRIFGRRRYYLVLPPGQLNLEDLAKRMEGHRYVPKRAHALQVYRRFQSLWSTKPDAGDNG